MAHKKGGGSTRNGRDSNAQRLGVKVFGSEMIQDRKSTRLNSSHWNKSRMPSSA